MSLKWQYVNLGTIIPNEINTALSTIQTTTNTINDVLSIAKDGVSTFRQFTSIYENPLGQILTSLLNDLQSWVDSIFTSGISFLFVHPFMGETPDEEMDKLNKIASWGERPFIRRENNEDNNTKQNSDFNIFPHLREEEYLSPSQLVDKIVNSFYDYGDSNRPQWEGTCGGILFMGTAPNVIAPLSGMLNILKLLNFTRILSSYNELLSIVNKSDNDNGIVIKSSDIDLKTNTIKLPSNVTISPGTSFYFKRNNGSNISPKPLFQYYTYYASCEEQKSNKFRVARNKKDALNNTNLIKFESQGNSEFTFYFHKERSISSTPPDWTTYSLNSIGFIDTLYKNIKSVIGEMSSFATESSSAFDSLLSSIQAKLTQVQNMVKYINTIINSIVDAISQSGIYMLTIPPNTGGVKYLISSLRSATVNINGVDKSIEDLSTYSYSVGLFLTAGGLGPDDVLEANSIKFLIELFGGSKDTDVPDYDSPDYVPEEPDFGDDTVMFNELSNSELNTMKLDFN